MEERTTSCYRQNNGCFIDNLEHDRNRLCFGKTADTFHILMLAAIYASVIFPSHGSLILRLLSSVQSEVFFSQFFPLQSVCGLLVCFHLRNRKGLRKQFYFISLTRNSTLPCYTDSVVTTRGISAGGKNPQQQTSKYRHIFLKKMFILSMFWQHSLFIYGDASKSHDSLFVMIGSKGIQCNSHTIFK